MVRIQVKRLRDRYNLAVKSNQSQFKLRIDGEDCWFLTSYAKYMLQYLDMQGIKDEEFINLDKDGKVQE